MLSSTAKCKETMSIQAGPGIATIPRLRTTVSLCLSFVSRSLCLAMDLSGHVLSAYGLLKWTSLAGG